jgi:hypothetical protein
MGAMRPHVPRHKVAVDRDGTGLDRVGVAIRAREHEVGRPVGERLTWAGNTHNHERARDERTSEQTA